MTQAAPTDTRSTFIAQLLAPIPSPATTAEGKRLLRELLREAERAWSGALHRYHAAQAYRSYCSHTRSAQQIEGRRLDVPGNADAAKAHLGMISAVDRMMDVPAPTIGALRHKQKVRGFDGGRRRWEAAISDDEARLGC